MGVAAHVCAQTERDVSKTETSTANADAIPRVHSAQKRHLRRSFAVSLFWDSALPLHRDAACTVRAVPLNAPDDTLDV